MEGKILSVFLSLVILLSLAGCGNQMVRQNSDKTVNGTFSVDVTSDTDINDYITVDSVDTDQTDLMTETEPEGTTEKDNQNSFTLNADNQKPKVSNPSATKPQAHEQTVISQPLKPSGTDKSAEESTQKQTESPAPTKPAEKPITAKLTEPEFDIDYWISFAKNYALSVGLRLESSAVECWDNPIPANAKCKYLERDIKGRLNHYAKDEDITDVWIWAEKVSDNSYEIYIGYA